MTVIVQIGNSDDKLPQASWADFFVEVDTVIRRRTAHVYFSGASSPVARWQNAAWVFDVDEQNGRLLRGELLRICNAFGQDSIAWTSGATEFIGPCVQK